MADETTPSEDPTEILDPSDPAEPAGDAAAELAEAKAELDRLRAENARMKKGLDPTGILTVRANRFRLTEMLTADVIRTKTTDRDVEAASPLDFTGDVLTDRYVFNLLVNERGLTAAVAATWMAMGDFQRAFKWREIEPFKTVEVGPNDPAWPPAFFQDIVYATKSSFWGVGYVEDPFAVAEAYNSAAT